MEWNGMGKKRGKGLVDCSTVDWSLIHHDHHHGVKLTCLQQYKQEKYGRVCVCDKIYLLWTFTQAHFNDSCDGVTHYTCKMYTVHYRLQTAKLTTSICSPLNNDNDNVISFKSF